MRALLPLSADPVTFGHLILIRQARERFDEVVVAILDNESKRGRYLFTPEERLAFLTDAVNRLGLPGVRVIAAPGTLLVDVYLREACDAVVRGVRSEAERQSEVAANRLHNAILPGFDGNYVYVDASEAWRDVSSSLVKGLVSCGVDVSPFAPLPVKEALEHRILGRSTIAVTGPIASGKSRVSARLAALIPTFGIPCVHLSYDALLRDLYEEKTPGAERVRERLAALLGGNVRNADGSMNRAAMAATLFHPDCPAETRRAAEAITAPHVFRLERERLAGFTGVVILECATLVGMGMMRRANNRVVVVDAPERASMLAERGIDPDRARNVARHQATADETVAAVEAQIARDGHGSIVRYVNRRRTTDLESDRDVRALLDAVADEIPALFPISHRHVVSP